MGRLIDADTLKDKMIKYGFHAIDMTVTEFVEDMLPTVEAIPKDQYKADMVAMLCALQLQFASHGCKDMRDCWWLIEEKINKLKEETEVKDDKS